MKKRIQKLFSQDLRHFLVRKPNFVEVNENSWTRHRQGTLDKISKNDYSADIVDFS